MNNIKQIHEKKYKIVFCDIFDTILYRKVQPEYSKKIWSNHMTSTFDINIDMTELYNLRNSLEYELGNKNNIKGYDWEFTYNELMQAIYKKIKISDSFEIFKKTSEKIEIGIESDILQKYDDILNELRSAKKEGKKIYCVSDMYLSKKMIKEIFQNLKIDDLFDDIFVSCEYLKNKKTGNLYKQIVKKLKLNKKDIIMIGDNKSSDFEIPKGIGIDAILIDRSTQYKKYEDFLKKQERINVIAEIDKLSTQNTDNFQNSIFSLYRFIKRLYFNLIKNDFNEVIFLSREGEYLKKLFDRFVECVDNKKIKSKYLIVSRKATYLPSLKKLEEEDFHILLQQYVYISIDEFLKSLNFDKSEIEKIEKSFEQDCKKIKSKSLNDHEKDKIHEISKGNYNKKIIYLYDSKVLKYLKKNSTFKKIYEKDRVEQASLFKKYIKQITTEKRICVVDIGWNGSIQDNIQNILGKEYDVHGYLYGLISRNPEKCKNKEGLVFTNVPRVSNNYELYGENRTIYEILLGASHGSANKYIEKNNKVEVLTFEKDEEKKIYNNVVSKIQNEMINTFNKMLEILPNGYYNDKDLKRKINRIHFNMLFYPTKMQLTFFNRIYHYENFGVFEFTDFRLHQKLSFKFYIKENAKYVLKRKHFFDDAFWPILKLYNEKLYIPQCIYRTNKKLKFKMRGLI